LTHKTRVLRRNSAAAPLFSGFFPRMGLKSPFTRIHGD
jgi:hypothetical protein